MRYVKALKMGYREMVDVLVTWRRGCVKVLKGWRGEGHTEGTSSSAPSVSSAESFRRNLFIRTYRFAMIGRRERMEVDGGQMEVGGDGCFG